MKTIWLCRHGETEFNVEQKLQGASDSKLSAKGLQQLACLKDFFSDKPIEAVFSSDLGRAKHSAQVIAEPLKLSVVHSPLFRERSFGIYEGQHSSVYRAEVPDAHALFTFAPSGGESLSDVCERAKESMALLKSSNAKEIIIVAHGAFNRCFLKVACQLEEQAIFSLQQGNCCINRLTERQDGTFALDLLNYIDHLKIRD